MSDEEIPEEVSALHVELEDAHQQRAFQREEDAGRIALLRDEIARARHKIESVERASDEMTRAYNTSVADVARLSEALKEERADAEYYEAWAKGNARRLNAALADVQHLQRALHLSEAKIGGAARYVDQANARSDMLEGAMTAYEGIADERDRYRLAWLSARARVRRAKRNREAELRWVNGMWSGALRDLHRYRLAWLSARRRAADEANFGMEALELRDAEIARLKAELDNLRAALHGA